MNNHRHLCLRGENSTVHLPSVHIHALLYMTSAVLLAELMSSKAFHSSKPWSILYRIKCSPKSQETGGTVHPRVKRHQEPNAFLHNDEVEIFTVVVVENNVNPHWEDVGSHQSHQVSFIELWSGVFGILVLLHLIQRMLFCCSKINFTRLWVDRWLIFYQPSSVYGISWMRGKCERPNIKLVGSELFYKYDEIIIRGQV